jgi:phage terminase large subunit-like protein
VKEEHWRALLLRLHRLGPARRRRLFANVPVSAIRGIENEWRWQAREGQTEPEGDDWLTWLSMTGRGFGKTRAGAEWVWAQAREHPGARIALVGASIAEVRAVMVEGESGLLAVARCDEVPLWRPSRGEFLFPSGAIGQAWSGANPAGLRGPQHHFAWCDEIAKWRYPAAAWANLRMGLRLGERPRIAVTTTPAPGAALKAIATAKSTRKTGGRTIDNPALPAGIVAGLIEDYGGTRLGRQELDGVLFDDVAGALWWRGLIEQCRGTVPGDSPLARIVVGVDPPASAEGTCGIIVCAMDEGGIAWVLADCSIERASPKAWAERVAAAAGLWGADRVIAEKNNGGEMVAEVLAGADTALPVILVSASRGKSARAEPVATRFETGKARFAGTFPALEDQLCGLTGTGYDGPGDSPDRADAMVWAMTELFKPPRAEPRILRL